jgi:hypothetical protein
MLLKGRRVLLRWVRVLKGLDVDIFRGEDITLASLFVQTGTITSIFFSCHVFLTTIYLTHVAPARPKQLPF